MVLFRDTSADDQRASLAPLGNERVIAFDELEERDTPKGAYSATPSQHHHRQHLKARESSSEPESNRQKDELDLAELSGHDRETRRRYCYFAFEEKETLFGILLARQNLSDLGNKYGEEKNNA